MQSDTRSRHSSHFADFMLHLTGIASVSRLMAQYQYIGQAQRIGMRLSVWSPVQQEALLKDCDPQVPAQRAQDLHLMGMRVRSQQVLFGVSIFKTL
jgi:hypothetical protein